MMLAEMATWVEPESEDESMEEQEEYEGDEED
jgi:hypothetical protein